MKTLVNKFIASVSVVMVMTSCSQEETVINDLQANQAIKFNVTANKASRAANYFNAATDINQFYVSAWAKGNKAGTDGVAYFTQDNLRKLSNTFEYDGGVRYWPNDGETLDFFAWTFNNQSEEIDGEKVFSKTTVIDGADKAAFVWNDGVPSLTGIEQQDAAAMNDLLYAATYAQEHSGKSATTTESKVTMSFNHAFAQVGIKAKVTNPMMRVQVNQVALVNIMSTGDFTFPSSNTKTDKDDATAHFGTWAVADDATATTSVAAIDEKIVEMVKKDGKMVEDLVDLTGADNTFMVLPLADAEYATSTEDIESTTLKGTCIRMSVKIWNIADYENGYKSSDIQIFGDGKYANIYIPVAFDWAPGKNYTYTIEFGQGNAGYDENGDNTVVKVSWTPEIMDWREGGNTDSAE